MVGDVSHIHMNAILLQRLRRFVLREADSWQDAWGQRHQDSRIATDLPSSGLKDTKDTTDTRDPKDTLLQIIIASRCFFPA